MQKTLGWAQLGLGYPEKAIAVLTRARDTFAARLGPDHLETLTSMNKLALSYRDAGRLDEALKLGEEAVARMKAKLGPDHPETLSSMAGLVTSYNHGRPERRDHPSSARRWWRGRRRSSAPTTPTRSPGA